MIFPKSQKSWDVHFQKKTMADDLPFRAEYAKTGRASCKKCKENIPQGTLRLAVIFQVTFNFLLFGSGLCTLVQYCCFRLPNLMEKWFRGTTLIAFLKGNGPNQLVTLNILINCAGKIKRKLIRCSKVKHY